MCTHHAESTSVRDQHRNNFIVKPKLLRHEIPPPPYETLFGQEISCAPPTYSSLALNQSHNQATTNLPAENHGLDIGSGSFVAVIIEQENVPSEILENNQERRVLRSQSVPNAMNSSSQTKHISVLF